MTKPHYLLLFLTISFISCKGTRPATDAQIHPLIPLLLNGEAGGCGFFFVYKYSQDNTKAVGVQGDMDELRLSKAPKIFDIENTPSLDVRFYDFGTTKQVESLCADSVPKGPVVQEAKAISGKATIFITRERIKESRQFRAFAITVVLENVMFSAANGNSFHLERTEMEDVVVGTQSP